ncbi:MAG: sugar ABC transporter permease [Eubacteriales bacterium]|nr:sugar ABC transporter permease [Eubacteriales bacterium]
MQTTVSSKKTRLTRAARGEERAAWMFLFPSVLGFICFVFIPMLMTLGISFTKYNVITPPQWTGAKNWIHLTLDKRLLTTLGNSAKYVLLLVPMHTLMSLLLALGVNAMKSRHTVFVFRTIYYFPTLIATSSVAMVWVHIFNYDYGLLNYALSLFGIAPITWLKSSFWVYPATMIFSLWKFVGGYFLYFLIGLQGIDRTYLEAAEIDGASSLQKLRHVTLPLLSPTTFFIMITQMIGTIQIFDEPYLITGGGPGDASRSISMYIHNMAYNSHNYGYAAAMSLLLLVIVLIVTLIQFKGSNWVNYDR